jgi:putative OPT family oligopeptide transporter
MMCVQKVTLKALLLSIALAALLGSANAYLALKVGMTISASIPAAVLAMTVLSVFRQHDVYEVNFVQTAASAGEGVAGVAAFFFPVLIMTGVWSQFDYWHVALITLIGGWLGVIISVPMRRILLNLEGLRFPEGVAIGTVLRARAQGGSHGQALLGGGALGALSALLQSGFGVVSGTLPLWWRHAGVIWGISWGFDAALLGAGFIVGINVAAAVSVGVLVGWLLGIPWLSFHHTTSGLVSVDVMRLWSAHLRYIGVGVMLVGGVNTLLLLCQPLIVGIRQWSVQQKSDSSALTERDMPLAGLGVASVLLVVALAFGLWYWWPVSNAMQQLRVPLLVTLLLLTIICGLFSAAMCGYLTGLVGATNNPLSGVMILMLLIVVSAVTAWLGDARLAEAGGAVILLAVSSAVVIGLMAQITAENMQDLKAGQMVGAIPWKQQAMLMLGVLVMALLVAPILNLLLQAYGLGAGRLLSGGHQTHALLAPQAGLFTALLRAFIAHDLPRGDLQLGVALGLLVALASHLLRRRGVRFSVLAVGLGIYLPMQNTTPLLLGGVLSWWFARQCARQERPAECQQNALMMACGWVAGAAIMGMLVALPVVWSGRADVLQIWTNEPLWVAHSLGVLMTIVLWYVMMILVRQRPS